MKRHRTEIDRLMGLTLAGLDREHEYRLIIIDLSYGVINGSEAREKMTKFAFDDFPVVTAMKKEDFIPARGPNAERWMCGLVSEANGDFRWCKLPKDHSCDHQHTVGWRDVP